MATSSLFSTIKIILAQFHFSNTVTVPSIAAWTHQFHLLRNYSFYQSSRYSTKSSSNILTSNCQIKSNKLLSTSNIWPWDQRSNFKIWIDAAQLLTQSFHCHCSTSFISAVPLVFVHHNDSNTSEKYIIQNSSTCLSNSCKTKRR